MQWTTVSVMSWWLLYRCFIAICKCFLYWNCSRKTFWSPEMWLLGGPRKIFYARYRSPYFTAPS